MAVSGFRYAIAVGGVEISFQQVSVRQSAPPIDSSSRLDRSGNVNQGYSMKDKDLETLQVTATSLTGEPGNTFNLDVGLNENLGWEVAYDDVPLYSGTGLYVEEYNYSGSIPGNATVTISFFSDGPFDVLT